jgi:hypothetical protein
MDEIGGVGGAEGGLSFLERIFVLGAGDTSLDRGVLSVGSSTDSLEFRAS